jgi:hypothetical protein
VKSGFVYPEHRWLVSEPAELMPSTMHPDDFIRPLGTWTLQAGLSVEVTAGAFISIDFSNFADALPVPDDDPDKSFRQSISTMRKRVQVGNAFALCLHSATADIQNLATDGFRLTHEDLTHYDNLGQPIYPSAPVAPGLGYVLPHRMGVCPAGVVDAACSRLDEVLLHANPNAVDLVVLLNHALTACRGHDFDLAVVTAWTVCETLLDQSWREYAEQRATNVSLPVNADRRAFWSGREFSASAVTEILVLGGAVPAALHAPLSDVRRKRNRWIHGIKPPVHDDAVQAITVARQLMSHILGLDMHVVPTVGVTVLG